jgi:anaerobic magnesium-protoporphyrin IX monomethyl ester cyclase
VKTLLIHPYTDTDHTAGRYKKFLSAMPPISLGYVAAAIEKAGLPIAIYDDFLYSGSDVGFIDALKREKPDLIGLTCFTPNYPGVKRVVALARRHAPQAKILLGNIHADIFSDYFLEQDLADYVVHGEGEITTVELIQTMVRNGDLAQVQGISFMREGKIHKTPERPLIQDLDSIPFPAWHLFPYKHYKLFSFARLADPATLILGSRGCAFKCNYCSLKIMGTARRKRSVGNVVSEIEFMHERYGMKQVAFVDPIFPINTREAVAFRDAMVEKGLHKKVVWTTETRVDLMNDETAAAIYEAGCRRVMFGFETGSDDTLKNIVKKTTTTRAQNAVQVTRRHGLGIIGFFMLGVPGDNATTMEKTIKFACKLDIDFAKFTVFVPYPGTDIFRDLVHAGKLRETEDWERYTSYPTKEVNTIYTAEGLTNADLVYYQRRAFRRFYLRPWQILKHIFVHRAFTISEMFTGLRLVLGFQQKPSHNLLD